MPKEESLHRTRTVALWVWQVTVALLFLMAGGMKLAGVKPAVLLYQQIGIGQWFRYVTGVLEIAGAVALLIPRTATQGAMLLAVVMAGATFVQMFVVHGSPVTPAVLLGVLGLIAWVRHRKRDATISRSEGLAGRGSAPRPAPRQNDHNRLV